MEELSLDLIFHNNFWLNVKSFSKQNCKLRIHSKLDRNQSKLSVCTGYSAYNAMSTYRNAHKKERHIVILGFLCRKKFCYFALFLKIVTEWGRCSVGSFLNLHKNGNKMCRSFYVHFGRHHMLS